MTKPLTREECESLLKDSYVEIKGGTLGISSAGCDLARTSLTLYDELEKIKNEDNGIEQGLRDKVSSLYAVIEEMREAVEACDIYGYKPDILSSFDAVRNKHGI